MRNDAQIKWIELFKRRGGRLQFQNFVALGPWAIMEKVLGVSSEDRIWGLSPRTIRYWIQTPPGI